MWSAALRRRCGAAAPRAAAARRATETPRLAAADGRFPPDRRRRRRRRRGFATVVSHPPDSSSRGRPPSSSSSPSSPPRRAGASSAAVANVSTTAERGSDARWFSSTSSSARSSESFRRPQERRDANRRPSSSSHATAAAVGTTTTAEEEDRRVEPSIVVPPPVETAKYTYDLDDRSIALRPASPRGSSRFLIVDDRGVVSHRPNFAEAFGSCAEGRHVVFNDSRVLEARVFLRGGSPSSFSSFSSSSSRLGRKDRRIECMILDLGSVSTDATCDDLLLRAMIRSEDVREGDSFEDAGGVGAIEVVAVEGTWEEDEGSDGNGTECLVRIRRDDLTLGTYLRRAGEVPIPPYLRRDVEDSDRESYNNAYATHETTSGGSVAAPTAGLHFTPTLLDEIGPENCSYLSLHVGAGTFKPVKAKDARDHEMHAERYSVPVRELKRIVEAVRDGKELITVGTTSCRTLESLYWCGVKRIRGLDEGGRGGAPLELGQLDWAPLQAGRPVVDRASALEALLEGHDDDDDCSVAKAGTVTIRGGTSLMIAPPSYEFRVVDHLVTNFHAPDSTLMLLVCAFLRDSEGDVVRRIYEDAQRRGYRFLSYGDVCMFSRPKP